MSRYLKELIASGEGLKLDFKYCISDSRKIARTFSAFANTEGGILLIGVKDNGTIAGVRSDEEIYMIETASKLFCRPEIPLIIRHHTIGGKTVLEVKVEKGRKRPYSAKTEDGRWRAYSRQEDQNIVANRVLLDLWKKEKSAKGVMVTFTRTEDTLLDWLRTNDIITLSAFMRLTGISSSRARQILVNLILLGIVDMNITEKGVYYHLNRKESKNNSPA